MREDTEQEVIKMANSNCDICVNYVYDEEYECYSCLVNLDEDEITMDSKFEDDLGADSLDVFQIIMGIEEEFDIEIQNEEAEKIVSVSDAVEQIKAVLN